MLFAYDGDVIVDVHRRFLCTLVYFKVIRLKRCQENAKMF